MLIIVKASLAILYALEIVVQDVCILAIILICYLTIASRQITYLDEDLRILRARKVDAPAQDSFLFIFVREESSRFQISI